MRIRLKSLLCTIISVLVLLSCSKESMQMGLLEGTWGLVHYDYSRTENGSTRTESTDYDPYNPSSRNDGKVAFINTQGNTFLMTFYEWNTTSKEWDVATKFSVEYRSGQLYYEETKRSIDITTLNANQLVLEAPVYNYPDSPNTMIGHTKMVFRKMQNIGL